MLTPPNRIVRSMLVFVCLAACRVVCTTAAADDAGSGGGGAPAPEGLLALAWGETWAPSPGEAWREHWFLDGAAGRVVPTPRGFELRAGPMETADAGHTVLWTRRSFTGDLRVDFRYTRLDDTGPGRNGVNILYFHAQGSGKSPYERDIHAWRDLRTVAAMKWYFEHMDAYHISFSAYSRAESTDQDYVRFRRYLPERGKGLAGTEVLPTYHAPELFRTSVPYAFTLIRRGAKIFLVVRDERRGAARVFAWDASSMPLLESGRIGIRHMAGRASLYEDFRVRFGTPRER